MHEVPIPSKTMSGYVYVLDVSIFPLCLGFYEYIFTGVDFVVVLVNFSQKNHVKNYGVVPSSCTCTIYPFFTIVDMQLKILKGSLWK